MSVRRLGPLGAAALVILTGLVVLLGVFMNRRGQPDAALTLTERELPLGWSGEENSGLALRLDWGGDGYGYGREPEWFDRDKLSALGFDCRRPLDEAGAELWYGKQLPLQRYAVLEFEGKAWAAWLVEQEREISTLRDKLARHEATERDLNLAVTRLEADKVERSRLFLVDVGRDAASLRSAYPDRGRFLILPAVVELEYRRDWDSETKEQGPPYLRGRVSRILVDGVHVARRLRAPLDAVREEERRAAEAAGRPFNRWSWGRHEGPPRYEVTLKIGRRLEPWIAELHRRAGS